jgi:hypothetical protein
VPHVVVRIYPEAGPLIAVAREGEDEIREIMRSVPGFRSYGILDTGGGILSVTSCEDKAGTDESSRRAAEFVMTHSPADVNIAPPQVIEGEGIWRFETDDAPGGGGAHVAVRIFNEPAPAGLRDRKDDVRRLMTAVDGFYSYGVIDTGGGGVTIIAGRDKEATDEVRRRMQEFVSTQFPDTPPRTPQLIEGEGLYRFVAQAAPA